MGEKRSGPALLRSKPRLLYIGLNNQASGTLSETHSHSHSEFMFMKSGLGRLEIGGESYPFKAGDLVIMNKNVPHAESYDEAQKNEVVFFGLEDLNLEDGNVLKNHSFCIIKTEGFADALSGYLDQLLYEAECDPPFSHTVTQHLLQIILVFMARLAGDDLNLTFTRNNAYLEAKEYFDKNFTNIDNLDNVCKTLYINKFYLTHVFKQKMGIPPVKYLILKRMELAKTLLATTDIDINDVAKRCGYVDTPYFCRVFKKTEFVTPLQYRFNVKNNITPKKP